MLAPFIVVDDLLGRAAATQLLQYAVANESGFRPAKLSLGYGGLVDESRRISKVNLDIAPVLPLLEPAIRKAVDQAIPQLGLVNVDSYLLELQLGWCGDGGFFKTHTDALSGDRLANQRVMTVVYYFYKEPKPFTGGQLRLYGLGADAGNAIQQDPLFDRAVLFPAWFPHEVLPVHCSSRAFVDGRFTVSCWVRKSVAREEVVHGNQLQ